MVLGMGLPPRVLAQLLDDMSTIEWRLAAGCSEKVSARPPSPTHTPHTTTHLLAASASPVMALSLLLSPGSSFLAQVQLAALVGAFMVARETMTPP